MSLAKTAYLPEVNLHFELNRATRNNVFGLILPNRVIPAISGPALEDPSISSTWGSAAGLLFSWEPFDFGLRKANTELAQRVRRKAQAGVTAAEYEISLAVTEEFLSVLAARQAVLAAQANVDRMEKFSEFVGALVKSTLRPGADESRATVELTRARVELTAAASKEKEAKVALAEWMGWGGHRVDARSGRLLQEPPAPHSSGSGVDRHPWVAVSNAGIDVVRARKRSIEKSHRPRFELLSAVYGRGTGANLDGTFQGGVHGLAPSTGNWAVGFSVNFPIFEYKKNRLQREMEGHNESREVAHLQSLMQRLKAQVEKAQVQLEAAREIASQTPKGLESARVLELQSRTRYEVGLATVLEVAEAQRLLRQAETDDALAKLGIWRALFSLAAAEGDMTVLLNQSE